MKKKLIFVTLMVLTMLMIGCSAKETKTEKKDTGKPKAGETFTLGFDASFPPYGYQDDDGEYVGFDLDLAQEVCDRNEWELVKQPIDWDSKDMELSSGTIDCIWNGFTMNGREDKYVWSKPYVDNSQVVVVKKDSGITTLKDLTGKNVVVQADSSALAALEDPKVCADLAGTFGSLDQVPEYNTAFMNLEAGAADAVALDIGVAKYQIDSRGDGFVMLKEELSAEQYGIGFALGNEALRDAVQKSLDEMSTDGTLQEIGKKWGVEDAICIKK
ncbi:MAG: amino acid ABC transporter substrate-binding protein [Lachnospiraceae bacterium]